MRPDVIDGVLALSNAVAVEPGKPAESRRGHTYICDDHRPGEVKSDGGEESPVADGRNPWTVPGVGPLYLPPPLCSSRGAVEARPGVCLSSSVAHRSRHDICWPVGSGQGPEMLPDLLPEAL